MTSRLSPLNSASSLLALHTAADECSVALWANGSMHRRVAGSSRAHAERLVPLIEEILTDVLKDPSGKSLNGIVVASGPGSFTGLRIGVASAKGLAWAHDLPVFAVSTLAGYAAQAYGEVETPAIVSVMPARKGELYAGIYDLEFGPISGDAVVPSEKLISWISEYVTCDVTYAGPDVTSLFEAIPELRAAAYVRTRSEASSLIAPVLNRPESFRVLDLSAFEPDYLKSFVARRPSRSMFDRLPF